MRGLPRMRGNASILNTPIPQSRLHVPATQCLPTCHLSAYAVSPRTASPTPRPMNTTCRRHASSQPRRTDAFKTPPREVTEAPRPDNVDDASYAPAATSEGLEEIGGLRDWWENPENWYQGPVLEPFANPAVAAPEMLPRLVEQAVREALAVKLVGKQDDLMRTWDVSVGQETREKLMGDGMVKIKPSGKSILVGKRRELVALVDVLLGPAETEPTPAEMEPATAEMEPATAEMEPAVVTDGKVMEKSTESKEAPAEKTGSTASESWKAVSLRDPLLRFAVLKRVQQLTGHRVPDHKQIEMDTAGDLYACVAEPPKLKKLADELLRDGELTTLSNVNVYPRRVTPVDKEKMVGRWKVIVDELKKRDLPIIGTGGHGGTVEKRWFEGKV